MSDHVEIVEVSLRSGGGVSLSVGADWLSMSDDDLRFVRGIAAYLRTYESGQGSGVAPGAAGGGGGSEPPPSPPVPGPLLLAGMVAAKIEEDHARQQREALACPPPMQPRDVPQVVLPPWPVEGEGDASTAASNGPGTDPAPSHPEPDVPLDSQGLPFSYRCDLCPRVLLTVGGKARHMTVAHHSKPLTREQIERQTALTVGDPGGYVGTVGPDGLVECGIGDCTARRSVAAIDRHRLSMHGEG